MFAERAAGLLFAGDHVLPTITPSIGFTVPPVPDPLGDFMASLTKVRSLPDLTVLPAHGPVAPSSHARVDELLGVVTDTQPDVFEARRKLNTSDKADRPQAMADLDLPDRCWAVAGLTRAGITAPDIADRLGCSLRLVRSVRAEPMTQLCIRYMAEADHFTDELRLARSEQHRLTDDLNRVTAEHARVKCQLANLLDAHMVGAVSTC